jgi:hypothetical protein
MEHLNFYIAEMDQRFLGVFQGLSVSQRQHNTLLTVSRQLIDTTDLLYRVAREQD